MVIVARCRPTAAIRVTLASRIWDPWGSREKKPPAEVRHHFRTPLAGVRELPWLKELCRFRVLTAPDIPAVCGWVGRDAHSIERSLRVLLFPRSLNGPPLSGAAQAISYRARDGVCAACADCQPYRCDP
jgi:hypothetical protein